MSYVELHDLLVTDASSHQHPDVILKRAEPFVVEEDMLSRFL